MQFELEEIKDIKEVVKEVFDWRMQQGVFCQQVILSTAAK